MEVARKIAFMGGTNLYCSDELWLLYKQWNNIHFSQDGFFSGVLADYMEDHMEEIIEVGNTKTKIQYIIATLRYRFTSPVYNVPNSKGGH